MTISELLRPRTLALCVGLAGVMRITTAAAQAEDQATARTLFNDARDLMKAGHYDQACPKLEAANKVYPGSGVLLNLGDCYEHLGRTASAWTEFGEAASSAERMGRAADKAEAQRRQSAIEPKLSRLAIRVSKEAPGLVVKRDGSALDRGAWGIAIPVDPGSHAVSAEASGFAAWSGTASVTDAGKTVTIDVPELQALPAPPVPPPSASETPSSAPATATSEPPPYWTGRRVASAAITVGGLVLWLTAPDAQVQVGASGEGVLVRGTF
jgi:hypothetical protein